MHIELDIRTLVFILGITHFLQVLIFYLQYRISKNYQGVGWWLAWCVTEAVGFGVILFRDIPSLLPLVILIQNSMVVGGTLFLYFGVRRFFNHKLNLSLLIPIASIFLAGLLLFLFVNNNIHVRSGLVSATIAIISVLTVRSLLVYKTRRVKASANFLAGIFIVHGAFFILRFVQIFAGARIDNIFAPTLFNLFPYFDALVVSLALTFGFILMLNQRLNTEISEAKENLQLIFNTSPDAAIITRLDDGKIVDFNEGYSAITGYSPEEISGKSILDINFWKSVADRQQVIRLLKEQGYCVNYEAVLVRKDGVEIIGLMSAKMIYLQDIPHIISITRDITQRKQVELEIKLKNEELLKLIAEKDKLFSIIAHDLRSPLNGFLGLTQIMAEDLPSLTMEEIQEIAVSMRNSATNLFRLLENLLQWAKMQQGIIPFNPEILDLLSVIDDSIAMVLESAKRKKIEIAFDIPVGLTVFADCLILQTIIRNLVSNAIKFTAKGGKIFVSAKLSAGKGVEISVKDTGIGMSQTIISNLFRFDIQSNRKGTEGEPSSGLGLLICKEFIEKHGGEIWIKSKVGEGSDILFTLPSSKSGRD